MRTIVSYCLVAAGVGVLSFFGCSSKDTSSASTTAGIGGTGPTTTTATSMPTSTGTKGSTGPTTTAGVTGAGGSGGGGTCAGIVQGAGCDTCVQASCCAEGIACTADSTCGPCLLSGMGTNCGTDPLFMALGACISANCLQTCSICNPVTSEGCPNDGSTCDVTSTGFFTCFPPPNNVKICGSCNNGAGPFCGPDLHCGKGDTCSRYCCADDDCGSGKCNLTALSMSGLSVGLCEGGADAGAMSPSCDAPAVAASKGACFNFGKGQGGGGQGGGGGSADAGSDG